MCQVRSALDTCSVQFGAFISRKSLVVLQLFTFFLLSKRQELILVNASTNCWAADFYSLGYAQLEQIKFVQVFGTRVHF